MVSSFFLFCFHSRVLVIRKNLKIFWSFRKDHVFFKNCFGSSYLPKLRRWITLLPIRFFTLPYGVRVGSKRADPPPPLSDLRKKTRSFFKLKMWKNWKNVSKTDPSKSFRYFQNDVLEKKGPLKNSIFRIYPLRNGTTLGMHVYVCIMYNICITTIVYSLLVLRSFLTIRRDGPLQVNFIFKKLIVIHFLIPTLTWVHSWRSL